MLVHLRLGLSVKDVCVSFRTSEGTCSHLFMTWICFLQRSSDCCSHILHANKLMIDCQGILRNIFLICKKTIGYYKLNASTPQVDSTPQLHILNLRAEICGRHSLVIPHLHGLVSLVSGSWGGRISDHEITEKNLGL